MSVRARKQRRARRSAWFRDAIASMRRLERERHAELAEIRAGWLFDVRARVEALSHRNHDLDYLIAGCLA